MILRYALFIGYMASIALIGAVAARRVRGLDDFIAARGRLGLVAYVLLMVGSVFSGMTCIGVAGLSYLTGYANIWERVLGPSLAIALATILFAPRLSRIAASRGALTVQDFLAIRYSDERLVRGLSGLTSALVCSVYLIAQYVAIGVASTVVFGWEYWQGCLLAAAVVVAYVVAGGMMSVAWTTMLQASILALGTVAIASYVIGSMGGLAALNLKAASISEGPFHEVFVEPWGPPNAVLVGPLFNATLFGIAVTLGLSVAPHIVNNVMAVRDDRCIRWGPLACYAVGLAVIMSSSLLGIAARVAEHEGLIRLAPHPMGGKWFDMALPTLAEAILPEPLFAAFLVVVMAAVMSTTDRLLLTAGANIGYDLFKGLLKPSASEGEVKAVSRASMAILGAATLALALSPPPLLAWLIWLSLSLTCNVWLAPMICGVYWRRATREGCLASMVAGLVVTVATGYVAAKPPIGLGWRLEIMGMPYYFVLPGFIASWAAMIIASLATSKRK